MKKILMRTIKYTLIILFAAVLAIGFAGIIRSDMNVRYTVILTNGDTIVARTYYTNSAGLITLRTNKNDFQTMPRERIKIITRWEIK